MILTNWFQRLKPLLADDLDGVNGNPRRDTSSYFYASAAYAVGSVGVCEALFLREDMKRTAHANSRH